MSSTEKLKPGLKGTADLVVREEHTAPRVGSGRVHVLATPVMINVIEAAALAAIEHLLPEGHQSLGTRLDIRHFAATPVGMRVRAQVEVVFQEGHIDFAGAVGVSELLGTAAATPGLSPLGSDPAIGGGGGGAGGQGTSPA